MAERFSASRASRHRNCHASADLPLAIPGWEPPPIDDKADNAANRGTRMHELFAGILSLKSSDRWMMHKALLYVLELMDSRRWNVLIEQEEVAEWLPSRPTTTADLVLYLKDQLHVLDLKTGKIPVSPAHNDQLLFYAGTYLKYAPAAKEVHLHIVQPWAEVMEEQVVPISDLYKWMTDMLGHAVAIQDGDLTFGPGDHCLFCPANPHSRAAKGSPLCPAMMSILYPEEPTSVADMLAAESEQ